MRGGGGMLRFLAAACLLAAESCAGEERPTEATAAGNASCLGLSDCEAGVILPAWLPPDPPAGDKVARATVYFAAMAYVFLGMSIIADRFMASIEVITSQEREVTVRRSPGGETFTTKVRVWNETVSNLTLMALGSSAPEILLSVIEVCGHGFEAGVLGPATIVGSAAFNMFIIVAICVYVVPDGEARRVKHLRVFFVTASWSIFAYVWLYLILAVSSPAEVEVWEALVTFAFFPCCVLLAWIADRRLLLCKYLRKHYRADKSRGTVVVVEAGGRDDLHSSPGMDVELDGTSKGSQEGWEVEEEAKRVMARILKDLKQRYPEKDQEQLLEMANYQALVQQQKSRAFYRIQATRRMTGEGNVLKRHAAERTRRFLGEHGGPGLEAEEEEERVSFLQARYECLESCGFVRLAVLREGGRADRLLAVDYRTEDGTARAGSDYERAEGTLRFGPGERRLELAVRVVDDEVYEQDEFFRVRLSNPRAEVVGGAAAPGGRGVLLGPHGLATITIFDDDHAGKFSFERPAQRVSENVGTMAVRVVRTSGARGAVLLPYGTAEGTARVGEDFISQSGTLLFQNEETLKIIEVQIIDDEEYEKNKNFFIELGEPWLAQSGHPMGDMKKDLEIQADPITSLGCPFLGEHHKMEVVIEESYEFKSTVDKLIKKTNLALVVSSSSWREQFVNAVTVSAGEDDDEEGSSEEHLPSCFDYIMHFLTVFWKVLFAFVPPTEYLNGWACFVVSIMLIGLLTAVTGDLAKQFGCTVGLKNSVTAIVFVALGTSVPDTFASKVAAIQDQYADASIGNVTGSNAVNVFLGIGVAWTIAAIYWASKGKRFMVDPGNLAFSVTIFTIFAFIAVAILLYRRRPQVGGELGGPRLSKLITFCFFILLWLLYIILSSLEAYCYIAGF